MPRKKIASETKERKAKKTESKPSNKEDKKKSAKNQKEIESETVSKRKTEKIEAFFLNDSIVTECSNEARLLYEKSRFGTLLEDGRVQLTLIEGYHLLDKDKIDLRQGKRLLGKEEFRKKCIRLEKNFWTRYIVYADFRNRGYIIKTALKFGADFRVYDKGVKPGEDHARWIVYPVKETDSLTWYEFAAKNRVAHSTKKRLLVGVVDEENSVTYYEIKWTRP
ncbi:tRNA-intron lyase [Candidatus Woesearchaeota archaeon]|nr:tRNA-intron lyase [Candidatus Woesearchaeota archaeon]